MRIKIALVLTACALGACSPPPASTTAPPTATPPATIAPMPAVGGLARVTEPLATSTVTSPLHVSGVAPANWFFENSFPVRLEDAQGQVLAQAPATPRINWTQPGDKEFDATLIFVGSGPATLVLREDMPGEGGAPREVRVPVNLGN